MISRDHSGLLLFCLPSARKWDSSGTSALYRLERIEKALLEVGTLRSPAAGARRAFWSLFHQVNPPPECLICGANGAAEPLVHKQPRKNSFKQDPLIKKSPLGLPAVWPNLTSSQRRW